jgi:hypothetical protein
MKMIAEELKSWVLYLREVMEEGSKFDTLMWGIGSVIHGVKAAFYDFQGAVMESVNFVLQSVIKLWQMIEKLVNGVRGRGFKIDSDDPTIAYSKEFQSQVDQIKAKIQETRGQGNPWEDYKKHYRNLRNEIENGPPIKLPEIELPREAVTKLQKHFEEQLRHMTVRQQGEAAGWTKEQIERAQQLADVEAELAEHGQIIFNSERNKLNVLNQQLVVMEKQEAAKKEQEKAAKKAQQEAEREAKHQQTVLLEQQKKLAREAHSMLEQSLTPAQKLNDELAKVAHLWASGALTTDEAIKIRTNLRGEFLKSQQVEKVTAGSAIRFGSAESKITQSERWTESMDKNLLKLAENDNVHLRNEDEILKTLQNNQVTHVVHSIQ